MRVLLSGGGTGGHINPALAIADIIKSKYPDSEIAFVGTPYGMENKLIPREGYKLYHVNVKGISRSLSLANIKALSLALSSPREARKIINEFKPDIVIGTGGYVCWPILVAASKMNIPCAVHEANAIPGAAVKRLQKYCDTVFTNFEESEKYLRRAKKIVNVGNPIRNNVRYDYKSARKELGVEGKYKYVILSFGGSLGAQMINDGMLSLFDSYVRNHPEILAVHSAGTRFYAEMTEKSKSLGLDKCENIRINEYIYDMPMWMAAADIVVSRAGAMTISEIALNRKAAITIPSPNVTNNHQLKNARVLSDRDAGILIEESENMNEQLEAAVKKLISDPKMRKEMSDACYNVAHENVNEEILAEIELLVKNKREKK